MISHVEEGAMRASRPMRLGEISQKKTFKGIERIYCRNMFKLIRVKLKHTLKGGRPDEGMSSGRALELGKRVPQSGISQCAFSQRT